MSWTSKYNTFNPVSLGRAFEYSDGIVWQELETNVLKAYYWNLVDVVGVEILDVTSDLPDFTTSDNMISVFNDEVYSAYLALISGDYYYRIAKYSGTPNNWSVVYTSPIISIVGTKTINFSATPSTLYASFMTIYGPGSSVEDLSVRSLNGTSWTSIAGVTGSEFQRHSLMAQRDETVYQTAEEVSTNYLQVFSGDASWSLLNTISSPTYYCLVSDGDIYSAWYVKRASDSAIMRTVDDGNTFTTTGATTLAAYKNYVFAAGGRDFVVISGDLYYYDGLAWILIETLPLTTLNAVMRVGDKLWVNVTTTTTDVWYEHSTFDDWNPITPVLTESLILSLSSPLVGGDYFWSTIWDGTNVYLDCRSKATGLLIGQMDLGEVSSSQLFTDYVSRVFAYSDTVLFLAGRINLPDAGLYHIVYSVDGGVNWSSIENTWGTDICTALTVDQEGILYAIRGNSTSSKLYVGLPTEFSEKFVLPYNKHTEFKSISVTEDKALVLGSGGASPVMVVKMNYPYTDYEDITANHQNTETITGVITL